MKLWDWQEADQKRLAELGDVALLNMEPGAGKTVTAAASLARTEPERALIIAPQATHLTAWEPTIRALTGRDARIVGNGNKRTKEALTDLEWGGEGVFLCTPQFFTRAANDQWAGDFIVVDEVHQLTKPGSKGQKALSGYNTGDLELGTMFTHRLALSGTPLRNKFENAWSIARFLWPELYERGQVAHVNHWLWRLDRMTHMEIVAGRNQDGSLKRVKQWLTEREPGRWINECPGVIQHFRRRKCCEFHPNGFLPTDEPRETKRYVDLAPTQKRVIKELETHYMSWLEDEPLVTELPITMQQRLRQVTLGVPTVDWTVDEDGFEKMDLSFEPDCVSPFFDEFTDILDSLDEDEPVVVFLEHQSFAPVIVDKLDKLGIKAVEYSGATRATRDDALREFGQPGGPRVAVVVIAAGGTGLDGLQRVCKTEVWFETSTDNTNNIQAQARVDRLGAIGQVQRFILVDTDGRAEGRMSKQLEKLLAMRQSTTREESA